MGKNTLKRTSLTHVANSLSDGIRRFLGRPILLCDESEEDYWNLLSATAAGVGPQDEFEWLLVRDMVDETWSSRRYRRAEAGIVDARRLTVLIQALANAYPDHTEEQVRTFAQEFLQQDGSSRERHIKELAKCGISPQMIEAEALASQLLSLEVLRRMIEQTFRLRSELAHEIETYRKLKGVRARREPPILDATPVAALAK